MSIPAPCFTEERTEVRKDKWLVQGTEVHVAE